jgi:single-strand DNA-binding protein
MSNVFSAVLTIGRDAEVRYAASGMAILTVTGANNTGYGDKKKTNWIRVSVLGKRAEGELVNYLKKGVQIFVSGELNTHEYEKDGQTKTSLELNATIIDLVGGKVAQPEQTAQPQRNAAGFDQQQPKTYQKDNFDGENFSDDIPF